MKKIESDVIGICLICGEDVKKGETIIKSDIELIHSGCYHNKGKRCKDI